MSSQSLWPSFGEIGKIKTPKIILQEQAILLEKSSSGFLTTMVTTATHPTQFNRYTHLLSLTAPKVENFTANIVMLEHDAIELYPLTIIARIRPMSVNYTAENEEEFLGILTKLFAEKEMVNTIQSLLAQSKAISAFI
jgi:hypothetical protein